MLPKLQVPACNPFLHFRPATFTPGLSLHALCLATSCQHAPWITESCSAEASCPCAGARAQFATG
jgi:hypothetical protein